MNKDEVLKMAKERDAEVFDDEGYINFDTIFKPDQLLAFANACEKAGMEKAAKICESEKVDYALTCDIDDYAAYNAAIDHATLTIRIEMEMEYEQDA